MATKYLESVCDKHEFISPECENFTPNKKRSADAISENDNNDSIVSPSNKVITLNCNDGSSSTTSLDVSTNEISKESTKDGTNVS